MNILRRFRIRTQLIVTMGVVFLLFVVSAVVSLRALDQARSGFTEFIHVEQKLLLDFTELYADGLQMGQALRNIILDPQNPKAYQNFEKASGEMDKLLGEAAALTGAHAEKFSTARQTLTGIQTLRQSQAEAQREIRALVEQGQTEAAIAKLNETETPTWRKIKDGLLEQIKAQKAAIEQHETEMQVATAHAQRLSLFLAVAAVGLGMLVGFGIVLNLTADIRRLSASMQSLAGGQGDLSARLPVVGHNELSELASAFNQFVDNLRGMVNGIKGQADRLQHLSGAIAESSASLRQASHEQTGAVTSTASAVEELTASIASVADNTEQVRRVSQQSADFSGEGLEKMTRLAGSMSNLQAAVRDMSGSVGQFLESTHSIIGATQHVKDIADQINLLALNAAIEAARAGEQGRGFAVVADEVRKLAEKTAQHANEITQVTAELETRSGKVEQAIRQGETVLEDSARCRDEASEIVAKAHDSVHDASRGVEEIARTAREQSQASSQIAGNVERLADLSAGTEHAIDAADRTVRDMRALADDLLATVARFKS